MNALFILLQHLVPQHLLSRLAGSLAECRIGWLKNLLIRRFISIYGVNMQEAQQSSPEAYEHFNAFFTRPLRPGMRPLPESADALCCPADGAVSALGPVDGDAIFQAKGRSYSLQALLGGNEALAGEFRNGSFATVYLSPKDYHRVHMPFSGSLREMIYVPGKLFSVNQVTAENIDALFARNERAVCIFDTEAGPMAVILVGAMIVAAIETAWAGKVAPAGGEVLRTGYQAGEVTLQRGEEMGRFKLGSTAIVLFAEGRAIWDSGLGTGSEVRMGQAIGRAL